MMSWAAVLVGVLAVGVCLGQDPAQGWLGYAKGTYSTGVITSVEMKWKVGDAPKEGGGFYSPWFGIETSDNLNLVQPVNPWVGSEWQIYNEYFQWRPEHNENSASHRVKPGDVLYGRVTFNEANQSYTMYHSDMNDGWSVTTVIPVQKELGQPKKYTIIYVVFEKVMRSCRQYPPNGEVTFYDIKVSYGGQDVTDNVKWETAYVDNACNNRAHVLNQTAIQITWDTAAPNPPPHTVSKSAAPRLHA